MDNTENNSIFSLVNTEPEIAFTKESDENRRWQTVRGFCRNNTVLEGTVTEIRPTEEAIYAVLSLEGFDVLIPDAWFITDGFFNETYRKATAAEQRTRRYQCMRATVGAKVCYVVCRAERYKDPSSDRVRYAVAGSRTKALELKKKHFFFSDDLDPAERPGIGKIIDCKVLTVGENGVRAEAYGVDFYISNRHLGLVHPIMDARDDFCPGDTVKAMIQKLYVNDDSSIYLQASVRQMEHETVKDGYRNAHVGSTVTGYVANYNAERRSYTLVLSCGCYANCHQNSVVGGEVLALGDCVSVQIKEIRTGFVTGSCMRIKNFSRARSMVYSWEN